MNNRITHLYEYETDQIAFHVSWVSGFLSHKFLSMSSKKFLWKYYQTVNYPKESLPVVATRVLDNVILLGNFHMNNFKRHNIKIRNGRSVWSCLTIPAFTRKTKSTIKTIDKE